jgi:SAM-dependent methyltransferase
MASTIGCEFKQECDGTEQVDVIISLDSFEHFEDPAAILRLMHQILRPRGHVLASFGPTWYHPYGGHLYSVFPWAHCVFTERAMTNWRSSLPGKKKATTLLETGLNRMTVKRFERLVADSPFEFGSLEAVPIRKLRWAAFAALREVTTSIVRCRLVPRRTA